MHAGTNDLTNSTNTMRQVRKIAKHCVKSVRIRSYSGPHVSHISLIRTEYGRISPYLVRLRENAGKMRTRITPNTYTFYAVKIFQEM